jgi:hypothetical protein
MRQNMTHGVGTLSADGILKGFPGPMSLFYNAISQTDVKNE